MPARLRRWVLIWTPVVWLVFELIRYPKDVPVQSGAVKVLRGFFAPTVGNFPPLLLFAAAFLFVAWGATSLLRHPRGRGLSVTIIGMGLVLAAWGFVNGGIVSHAGFSFSGRTGYYTWLWQTAVVVMAAACVWLWAKTNPERAELMVHNTRQTWQLFRSNRQGILGLGIIVVFVLIALLAPFLANHYFLSPDAQLNRPPRMFQGPRLSWYHLLGTDESGLSIMAEFIWSARISLVVGLAATIVSTILGASIGIAAGYFGGWQGEIWMRITDAFLVIPWLPLAMVLAATWGQNYAIIIIIIGVTSWPGTARVVRADALRVRELPFIERAQAIGSSNTHIMMRHILPNVFPLIFANTILVVAEAITAETELSFLGLGDPLNFSWGTMLRNAWQSGATTIPAWSYILAPGIAVVMVVLAFTFMGTAFDEILDPKLRRREASGSATDKPMLTGGVGGPVVALPGASGGDASNLSLSSTTGGGGARGLKGTVGLGATARRWAIDLSRAAMRQPFVLGTAKDPLRKRDVPGELRP